MTAITALVIDDAQSVAQLRAAIDWARIGVQPTFTDITSAVSRASAGSFDAVISGASAEAEAVLERFSRELPDMARVQLTANGAGWSNHAHHVINPPIDAGKLLEALSSAMRLRGGVERTRLGQLIERARHLPTLPDVYVRIQEEIRQDDPSVAHVAKLIEQDPALSVKVIQLVNSPFMGLRREVADVKLAATLIGLQRLTSVVLASGVFKPLSRLDSRLVEQLWHDSLTVAGLARSIAREEGLDAHGVEEAQLAGLLHDLGELVLFQNWRDEYMQIDPRTRDADELRIFGATHADISGYLCSSWGLTRSVVDAVTHHHTPSQAPSASGVTPVIAVHAARALVDGRLDPEQAQLDLEYLESVGVAGRVADWAGLAVPPAA